MASVGTVQLSDGRIRLCGELRFTEGAEVWRTLLDADAAAPAHADIVVDLSGATVVDGVILALLVAFRERREAKGGHVRIVGANERVAPLVRLYCERGPPPRAPPRRGVLERLGEAILAAAIRARGAIELIGELVVSAIAGVLSPITTNWRAVPSLVERAGPAGVPIVLLLNFLVGFVMGYQSARQLGIYGANVFVADVVGISVTRELAPLMTAIILLGRSGAAFAAEIGTMKVSEELDALRTMGFSPVRWLVLPRIVSLVIVTPMLTLLGDVIGVAGGAVVGDILLGVGPRAYLAELRETLVPTDVIGGIVKSAIFGAAIALVGCERGFAVRGGAEGVGRGTTSAVVTGLFVIVVIDALFAVFLKRIGS